MKAGTLNHLKLKRLKRLLGKPLYQVAGILESLWQVTIEVAWEYGQIGKYSDEEIADAIEWDGDAAVLIKSLLDAELLDESDEHRLVVHDWHDHCPEYLKDRLRKQKARGQRKQRTYDEKTPDIPERVREFSENTGHAPECPVYTNPNQSKPIPTNPKTNPTNSAPPSRWSGAFSKLVKADLEHDDRLHERFRRAVALGAVEDTEAAKLRFFGAAERALEVGDDPPAMFRSIVDGKLYGHITQAQEDRANERLKRLRKSKNGVAHEAARRLGQSIRAGPENGSSTEP